MLHQEVSERKININNVAFLSEYIKRFLLSRNKLSHKYLHIFFLNTFFFKNALYNLWNIYIQYLERHYFTKNIICKVINTKAMSTIFLVIHFPVLSTTNIKIIYWFAYLFGSQIYAKYCIVEKAIGPNKSRLYSWTL